MCVHVCVLQVHAGWALDTDVFNEWMNEEDYCVDERNVPAILRQRIHLRDDQVCVQMYAQEGLCGFSRTQLNIWTWIQLQRMNGFE